MASLRSNGWAVTGKLRRDQPDIFAPEFGPVLNHHWQAVFGPKRSVCRAIWNRHGLPFS